MEFLFDILPIILVALLTIVLAFSIRVLQEDERFVEVANVDSSRLRGPGIVLALPGSKPARARVALGDRGTFLGDGVVSINGVSFPASMDSSIEKGDLVTIISFRDNQVHVMKT